MKKSLLALAALAALSLVFVSCGGGNDPDPDPGKSPVIEPATYTWTGEIALADNYEYGKDPSPETYLGQQVMVEAFKDFQVKKGTKVKIEIKATLDKAGKAICVDVIDNTADAGWWKRLTSGDASTFVLVPENTTDVDNSFEFEIAEDATAAGAAKLQVFSSDPAESNPKLTNVTITITVSAN